MRSVWTTGQVARLVKVAPRTVSKWFDSGRLKGYRIPNTGDTGKGGDRRVPRESLVRFLREHGMPLPRELERGEGARVLLVGVGGDLADRLAADLGVLAGLRVERAEHVFDAGLLVYEFAPTAAVVDLAVGRAEAVRLAAAVRRGEAAESPGAGRGTRVCDRPAAAVLVALAGEDGLTDEARAELAAAGFDHVLQQPADPAALADVIRAGREGE